MLELYGHAEYFNYKFTAITLGTILVTAAYLRHSSKNGIIDYSKFGKITIWFKYFAIVNFGIYATYICGSLYNLYMPTGNHFYFYRDVLIAMINVAIGYSLCRIPLLNDRIVQGFSMVFYCVGIGMSMLININSPVISKFAPIEAAEYGAIGVLLAFNVLMFLAVKELILAVVTRRRLNFEFYPLTTILYLLLTTLIIVTQQFHLGGGHFISSLVCLFAALSSIIYGFRKNYVYTRRFGLGLVVFATAKLFIIDLAFLDTTKKIIVYFCFGFVLLGISYLYQHLRAGSERKKYDVKM